ncbi:hypothetical protein KFL_002050090 [Klebsormidium nitens]|uniref:Uncharacterized protein n=1 Tax=Klebsormidium nitens TaxID=105231 RepID=A0A1Y1I7U1_KLENI|nr:hypothetical protein KFL_002050090 [Klebsormidium nitens]|eukprot:GAQ84767.1 hypothetical protein KFL_002050090 [Klebsormidium nitens]
MRMDWDVGPRASSWRRPCAWMRWKKSAVAVQRILGQTLNKARGVGAELDTEATSLEDQLQSKTAECYLAHQHVSKRYRALKEREVHSLRARLQVLAHHAFHHDHPPTPTPFSPHSRHRTLSPGGDRPPGPKIATCPNPEAWARQLADAAEAMRVVGERELRAMAGGAAVCAAGEVRARGAARPMESSSCGPGRDERSSSNRGGLRGRQGARAAPPRAGSRGETCCAGRPGRGRRDPGEPYAANARFSRAQRVHEPGSCASSPGPQSCLAVGVFTFLSPARGHKHDWEALGADRFVLSLPTFLELLRCASDCIIRPEMEPPAERPAFLTESRGAGTPLGGSQENPTGASRKSSEGTSTPRLGPLGQRKLGRRLVEVSTVSDSVESGRRRWFDGSNPEPVCQLRVTER